MAEEQEPAVDHATQQGSLIDFDKLAEKVVALLRRELELETERTGKLSQGR
jgi:hypothetical protein